MLVTGLAGSVASGQPRMDLLLPAELSFLTFPGMILMALAALKQRVYIHLSAALPVAAAADLALCQWLALHADFCGAQKPIMVGSAGLLLLFDLSAVTAPVMGLLSIRRLRGATP
ncbi:hypothetical protein [Pseudoflavonifractor phocaeensis]|uniref:hypothetical protein n=1 Tax=Pseudoflavonifractor phocaeensis TaxID=1870988 RepID=UPI001956124F|nr:hypothetical protein [Pseudoflavonifractor phocaeensis]MBM6926108.1 hypothetical protein [Pseudoflavonifractor phocaeensis]